ncbi:hypothetical protein SI65_08017 [Aspergillus cristatus]|uniref:Cytochrome b-c1 complex subunit 10 n=1 Tax=Aspergillus cristatus TaxID=573508 RepID=A0A1E3B6C2_ASPCR|nr:hypothetical protein SI65_08017 [Aspergillus cristatus]
MFSQTVNRAAAFSGRIGPKYYTPTHYHGLDAGHATRYGRIVGTFGLAAGVGALFFFGEVPRVRRDILQQFPFFDQYFDRRLAPEDNPF